MYSKKFSAIIAMFVVSTSITAQNYLDKYVGATVTPAVIASSADQISLPVDLDFKPNSHELWVTNYGNSNGGTTVIIYNAGLSNQFKEYRKDSHSGHFMRFPSAFAFGQDGFWANVNEIKSTASASSTFMGPALWSADTAIYARVFQNNWVNGLPLGSHYDMLHQSPFAMGIAHDSALAYWVNDGHNGNICLYDFVQHHGPGYDNHSAGKIYRYTDVPVSRVPNVPSHMVVDKKNQWLYFIDGGSKKLKRLKTNTGSNTGVLSVPTTSNEPLAAYQKIEGALVEDLATYTTQPCGIDYFDDRLIVSDYTNGNIYLYNTAGAITLLDTIATGSAGLTGIKIGPDGKIWCVNRITNSVYRLDFPTSTLVDAALTAITAPPVQNFKANFYSTKFGVCDANITPAVSLLNQGTGAITSATLQYSIDGGTPVNYIWSGSLAAGANTTITLPISTAAIGDHLLLVTLLTVNGASDEISSNNNVEGSFRTYNPGIAFPFTESFTGNTFPPAGWNIIEYNPNNKMSRNGSTGGFGNSTGCLKMDNFSGAEDITGQQDYFVSPSINVPNGGVNVSFNVAHAQYNTASNDELEVLASADCGATWKSIYKKSGSTLSTSSPSTTAWIPTATQWRKDTASMDEFAGKSNVLIAFKTTSNFGNNVYIDDINLFQTPTAINQVKIEDLLTLSPNPFSNNIVIDFNIATQQEINGKIVSTDGKVVAQFSVPKNTKSYAIDLSVLSPGMYNLHINSSSKSYSKKIVKN
jgi:hypothetical protein